MLLRLPVLRSILSKDVTDDELAYRQLTRKDFNMHVGQSAPYAVRNSSSIPNFLFPIAGNSMLLADRVTAMARLVVSLGDLIKSAPSQGYILTAICLG